MVITNSDITNLHSELILSPIEVTNNEIENFYNKFIYSFKSHHLTG